MLSRRFVLLVMFVTHSATAGADPAPPAGTVPSAPPAAPEGAPPREAAEAHVEAHDEPPIDMSPAATAARLQKLEDENQELREELELLKEDHTYAEDRIQKLSAVSAKLTGFLDVGFFHVGGDGSGIRNDTGHLVFPEYGAQGIPDSWVFLGDPLSTMVNARGEPATTRESRAITFDGIRSKGPTFLVNTLNVGLFAEIGKNMVFTSKLDVVPRGRDVADPDGLFLGDYLDMRLAYVEYRIERSKMKVDLFVGKFDSVIGFEYRSQEAPSRIEVTPSLICRYTCGFPIGVKARFRWFDDALVLNAAVTNGSQFSEGFAFYNEIDTNQLKTVSGRASIRFPFLRELELGVSGAIGAQDNQPDDGVHQWLYNIDLHLHRQNLVLRGEFIQGRAKGSTEEGQRARCGLAPCLEFKGAYGLAGYRLTNIVMPYVRVDWREAIHQSGASFVYISHTLRGTTGVRFTVNENLIIKAEYNVNRELGRVPGFPNDVFTSSLVVKY